MKAKILFILAMLSVSLQASGGAADALRRLDAELQKKSQYDAGKEARISILRDSLKANPGKSLPLYAALFDEYASYSYDSAYFYAKSMHEAALRSGERDALLSSGCNLVFCLLSAGFFKEAFDTAAGLEPAGCSQETLEQYYKTMVRLNYSAADYNYEEDWRPGYLAAGHAFSEKLLSLLDPDSDSWHYHHADWLMKQGRAPECIAEFNSLLNRDIDLHLRAIITSCLGWLYEQQGDTDLAVENLAEAAVCDLQSSTKETTALRMLADLLSRQGEVEGPTRYVRESFEDANFYNARLRKIEVGGILPIIERNHSENLRRERNMLLVSIIAALVLILVLIYLVFLNRRQNRKLDEMYSRLAEADAIKTAYIGNSFYMNAEYIDKISTLYKTVDRMLVTRQYDELRRSIKESAISKERDIMCDAFDSTFLTIFPGFVDSYNALFNEEDRVTPPKHGLTTEMRIFALIRLGITESERIAKFLDYSVHTINTYKTRVKNKSTVPNDSFEEAIMKIGSC